MIKIFFKDNNGVLKLINFEVVWPPLFLRSGVRPLTNFGGTGVRPLTEKGGPGVRPLTENTERGVKFPIVIGLQREVWFNVSRDPERR